MSKVTTKVVHDRVSRANLALTLLGVLDTKSGIGRLQAYVWGIPRRVSIQQVVNEGGGVRTLHGPCSPREAWAYVEGFTESANLSVSAFGKGGQS